MLSAAQNRLLRTVLVKIGLAGEELDTAHGILSRNLSKVTDVSSAIASSRNELAQTRKNARPPVPLTANQIKLPLQGKDYSAGVGSGNHNSPRGWQARRARQTEGSSSQV